MDDPTGWFEELYVAARAGEAVVPWDRGTHPLVVDWTARHSLDGHGRSALVVGSGLGADAEHLAGLGFEVTAFDVSQTAVDTTRERFPESRVDYSVANLLEPPGSWQGAFDFVLESLTVQSMPPPLHLQAAAGVSGFVAEGGTLLVVAGVHVDGDDSGPPWPLTQEEIQAFAVGGLVIQQLETLPAAGEPWRSTWRVELRRPD